MAAPRPVPRPHHGPARDVTRTLSLCALTLALLLGPAATAAVAGPGVSVHVGGAAVFISPAEVQQEADVPQTAYTLRSEGSSQVNDHAGLSVRKLLVLAGANPDTVGFVSVKRPDGTLAYLDGSDVADPPPFPEGPALVWVDGETSRFFRPVRDDRDVNAADNIGTASGQPLVASVHGGHLLTVTAAAAPAKAAAGADVSFSAHATGASDLKYTWTFDDGSHGHGAVVKHAYNLAGGYNAFVTVAGAGDSGGSSATIHIVVGNPPKGPASRAGGGSTKRDAPGGGSTSPHASGAPGPSSTTTPHSPAAATHSSSPADTSPPKAPAARPAPPAKAVPRTAPPAQPRLPLISGELLAYAQPLKATAAPASASIAGARAGTPAANTDLPVTGTAAALLIALGAAAEARGRRRIAR